MTNSVDGTVLCWQLVPGAFIKIELQNVRDLEWDRKACVFSWDTLGVWSKILFEINAFIDSSMKETDINQISLSWDQ